MTLTHAPFIQFQVVVFPETKANPEQVRIYALDETGELWTRLLASGNRDLQTAWQQLDAFLDER
jgi:hypothetical protein